MPTLTASPQARAAARQRGLVEQTATIGRKERRCGLPMPQRLARERLYPILLDVFPAAFTLPTKPLAIGIHHQILDVAGDSIDPAELSLFLRFWTSRWAYRNAVWLGMPRINLDGSVAGYPSVEQRNQAAQQILGKRAVLLPTTDDQPKPEVPTLKLNSKGVKCTLTVTPDQLVGFAIPGGVMSVPFAINVGGRTITGNFNARSLRRAVAAAASPAARSIVIQGQLNASDELENAGISVVAPSGE